jgi:hypothetical protein
MLHFSGQWPWEERKVLKLALLPIGTIAYGTLPYPTLQFGDACGLGVGAW